MLCVGWIVHTRSLIAHMNDHPHMDLTDKPRKIKAKRGSSTFSSLRRSVGDRFPLSWLPPATGPVLRELSVVWPSSICRKVMGDGVRQTMKRKGPPHFVKGPYACYRLTIDCFCALSVERGAGEKSSDPEKPDFALGSSSWGSAGSAFDEDSGGAELVDEGVAILFVRSKVQDEIAQQKTSKWKDCETNRSKSSTPIRSTWFSESITAGRQSIQQSSWRSSWRSWSWWRCRPSFAMMESCSCKPDSIQETRNCNFVAMIAIEFKTDQQQTFKFKDQFAWTWLGLRSNSDQRYYKVIG